jgi:prevent-host-death family protein
VHRAATRASCVGSARLDCERRNWVAASTAERVSEARGANFMIDPSEFITLADFKQKATDMIERLEISGRSQVLTVNGAPKLVVMAVDAFERMAGFADRPESVASIRLGLEDVSTGRTMPAAKVFEALRRNSDNPRGGPTRNL